VFYLPDYNSICLADMCNQCQHNVLTPRGAQVRDTLLWRDALDMIMKEWVNSNNETTELSAWGSHQWPRWGKTDVSEYIKGQRDLFDYLHNETVRLMNAGYQTNPVYDMRDAAEEFKFPDNIAKQWFNRGYYGATVHNVKAIYQKYLGWFNNNPATLWQLPAEKSAKLYATYMQKSGGNLLEAARMAFNEAEDHDNYRWVAEVLEHIRLAPDAWGASAYNSALRLQANAFEQMAYAAESGIWRNYFLNGTWRNRGGGGSSNGGCAAGTGAFAVSVLLILAVAAIRGRKR